MDEHEKQHLETFVKLWCDKEDYDHALATLTDLCQIMITNAEIRGGRVTLNKIKEALNAVQ